MTRPALLAALGGALLMPAAGDDWPAWRAGPARTGVLGETVAPPLTAAWSVTLGAAVIASPVVVDGRVYAAAEDGVLHCLAAADGAAIWSFQPGGQILATPACDSGTIYVAALNGTLYALRADNGQIVWQAFHGGGATSSPLVLTDRVVLAVGHPSYEVRAFSRASGATLWAFDAAQLTSSSPSLYSEPGFEAIVIGANNRRWYVIDPATGAGLWSYDVGGDVRFGTAAAGSGGQVAVTASEYDRKMYLLDVVSRALLRSIDPRLAGGATPGKALAKAGEGRSDLAPLTRLPIPYQNAILNGSPELREEYLKLAEAEAGVSLDGVRKAFVEIEKGRAAAKEAKAAAAAPGAAGKPGGAGGGLRYSHSPEGAIESSSPAFDAGKLYIVHRDKGWNGDVFAVYRSDAATGAAEGGYADGTLHSGGSAGYAPSAFVSGTYLYAPLGSRLAVFNKADLAAPVATYDVGAMQTASPVAANGLVVAGGADGRVVAFRGANAPPGLPTGYTPSGGANVLNHFPVFEWTGAVDPDPGDTPATLTAALEYAFTADLALGAGVVRRDLAAGTTQYTADTFIPANTRVYWRVRLRDAAGARSSWSPVQDFLVFSDPTPPDPPTGLSALPLDASVQLAWTASASPDVVAYNVYTKTSAQSFAQATVLQLGNVTSTTVGGLANGTAYDFMVTALDGSGNESAGVVVGATPRPDISINDGGTFLSVQSAIDAAGPGDVVMLGARTFNVPGGLRLKGGVSLRGYAPHLTILNGQGAPVVVRVSGAAADGRVTIELLTVTGGGVGVDTGRADVRLRNLQMVQLSGDGVVASPQAALEGVSLTIANNGGNGLDVRTPLASLRGMIVVNNAQFGVKGPKGVSVTYSDFFGNARGPATGAVSLDDVPGSPPKGNLFVSVAFTDTASYDYRELAGEATIDAGHPQDPYVLEPAPNGSRTNQGAFGNTAFATPSQVPPKAGEGADAVAGEGDAGSGGPCFAGAAAAPSLPAAWLGVAALLSLRRRRSAGR